MDVAILSGDAIRIKSKLSTIVINPTKNTNKTEANAVVRLTKDPVFTDSKIEGSRITIKGPGEFEVGGIKIKTLGANGNMVAKVDVELVKVLVGSGEEMVKLVEKIDNVDVLVVNADQKFNYSALTGFDAKVVLAHGNMSTEMTKAIGKTSPEKVHKYSTTSAKLPTEPEYFLLG